MQLDAAPSEWARKVAIKVPVDLTRLPEMSRTIACTVGWAKAVLGHRPTVALEEGMRRNPRWDCDHGRFNA